MIRFLYLVTRFYTNPTRSGHKLQTHLIGGHENEIVGGICDDITLGRGVEGTARIAEPETKGIDEPSVV